MIFCGSMLCADVMSVPCTPTGIDHMTKIELSNSWYDDVAVTENVTEELSGQVNPDWNFDTVLHAKFDGNPSAGNVNWELDTVSHLLIKRRKSDEFKWTTLQVQKVRTLEDFNLKNTDITAAPNCEYQYAAVPIINGIEGFYSVDQVSVRSNCLLIADRDGVWCTSITDNYLDNASVVPNSVITTMYDKYPTIVSNSAANYEEITVQAQFFPANENGCVSITDHDKERIHYHKQAKLFLRNGNGKILKSIDGACWLVYVTQPPQDTAVDSYRNRKLTFTCTEIADIEDEEALYLLGFTPTVTEEWWNR